MIGKGVDTDFDLRPKFAADKENTEEKKAQDHQRLLRQSRSEGLLQTDTGRVIWQELSNLLQARINKLIDNDPEAKAYKQMIGALGVKVSQARMAVKALREKYMKES